MRFEARDLKPYSEPVSENELAEGEVYFFLSFLDQDLLVPVLTPVVCLGRDPRGSGDGKWQFQDAESYFTGHRVNWTSESEVEEMLTVGELYSGSLKSLFAFERALDGLLRCSIERKLHERGR